MNRDALLQFSSGSLAGLFGPEFSVVDGGPHRVRLPKPPYLFSDEILEIEAQKGKMGPGSIFSRFLVKDGDWYVEDGAMPLGIWFETGQVSLLLASYMGVDLVNPGEMVGRVLGYKMKFFRDTPKIGELCEVRMHFTKWAFPLAFFTSEAYVDGSLAVECRDGVVGFFAKRDMGGNQGANFSVRYKKLGFDFKQSLTPVETGIAQGEALSRGGLRRIHGRFLDGIVARFDALGGPWNRGYLRSVRPIERGDWYFQAHFENDPCIPGSLMVDGAIRAFRQFIEIYLLGRGLRTRRIHHALGVDSNIQFRGNFAGDKGLVSYHVLVREIEYREMEIDFTADLLVEFNGIEGGIIEGLKFTSVLA